jgi:hypothetical protein
LAGRDALILAPIVARSAQLPSRMAGSAEGAVRSGRAAGSHAMTMAAAVIANNPDSFIDAFTEA